MTHHAKALPVAWHPQWADKTLSSPAPKSSATPQSTAAVTLTIALRYLALKGERAARAPAPQRPRLRIVT